MIKYLMISLALLCLVSTQASAQCEGAFGNAMLNSGGGESFGNSFARASQAQADCLRDARLQARDPNLYYQQKQLEIQQRQLELQERQAREPIQCIRAGSTVQCYRMSGLGM